MFKRTLAPVAVLFTAFALMSGSVGGAVAQDATPGAAMAHPAHIHSGACGDTLGDVVFPLEDVTATHDMMATPDGADMAMGEVVAESTTTVEVALDDVLAAEHAINVHESAENIGNYIACGDVTGEPVDGTLEIELEELNESGVTGKATLTDNGDGTTEVTVMLMEVDMMATPEA